MNSAFRLPSITGSYDRNEPVIGSPHPLRIVTPEAAMPETQLIRISMPDRPGALSQVCLALAAHGVDITHLDVVSAANGTVVDDLTLQADTAADLQKAISSFRREVSVMALPGNPGDPVTEFGLAIAALATAEGLAASLARIIAGCQRFIRADESFVLSLDASGGATPVVAARPLPAVLPGEPFAGRAVLSPAVAATFAGASDWAPAPLRVALGAAVIAMAPLGTSAVIAATRVAPIPFTAGEMRRLALYSGAASAILIARGLLAETYTPVGSGVLPPGAITELVPLAA